MELQKVRHDWVNFAFILHFLFTSSLLSLLWALSQVNCFCPFHFTSSFVFFSCSFNGNVFLCCFILRKLLFYFYVCSKLVRRRQWHPTPVLLPGKSHGWRSWWAAVHGVAKSRTWLSDFTFTFHFHASEKEMATHASVFAWRIPGTGEAGGLPSMGYHRIGHDWSDLAAAAAAAVS